MAKTKKPPKKVARKSSASGLGRIEDAVVDVTGKANKALRDFQTPLLIAGVVVVATIAVWGLSRLYEAKQAQRWSTLTYELLSKSDEEIESQYLEFLEGFRGSRNEPFAVSSVANWLQENDREAALRIIRDAHRRHPEDVLLALYESRLDKGIQDDKGFTKPRSRMEPEKFPGPLAPEYLEELEDTDAQNTDSRSTEPQTTPKPTGDPGDPPKPDDGDR